VAFWELFSSRTARFAPSTDCGEPKGAAGPKTATPKKMPQTALGRIPLCTRQVRTAHPTHGQDFSILQRAGGVLRAANIQAAGC